MWAGNLRPPRMTSPALFFSWREANWRPSRSSRPILAVVLEGLAQAKRREFATDNEVGAAFGRFGRRGRDLRRARRATLLLLWTICISVIRRISQREMLYCVIFRISHFSRDRPSSNCRRRRQTRDPQIPLSRHSIIDKQADEIVILTIQHSARRLEYRDV